MITKSLRTEITAVHLRPVVKEALREEAHKRSTAKGLPRVSMSAVISEAVEEKLTTLGYDLSDKSGPAETPLLDEIDSEWPCGCRKDIDGVVKNCARHARLSGR